MTTNKSSNASKDRREDTHIHDLSDDCLSEILRRVGSPPLPLWPSNTPPSPITHSLQCQFICKRWYLTLPRTLNSLKLSYVTLKQANPASLTLRFPNLRSLTLTPLVHYQPKARGVPQWESDILAGLCHLSPRLTSLDILFSFSHLHAASLTRALECGTNLQMLSLREFEPPGIWGIQPLPKPPLGSHLHPWLEALLLLPHLRTLRLACFGNHFKDLVWGRLAAMPQLGELWISSHEIPPASVVRPDLIRGLTWPCPHCPAPTTIEGRRDHRDLSKLVELTALESLTVHGWATANQAPLPPLPKRLGGLSRLARLSLPSVEMLPESVGDLSSLTALIIRGDYESPPSRVPETLTRLTNLRALHVRMQLVMTPGGGEEEGEGEVEHDCSPSSITRPWLPQILANISSLKALEISNDRRSMGNVRVYGLRLEWLPESIGKWHSLESLRLKDLMIRALPDGLCKLKNLRELLVEDCWGLRTLPEGVGHLSSLTRLWFRSCDKLERIPEGVGDLGALRDLSFGWCSTLRVLPESVTRLTTLTALHFKMCLGLERVPEGIKDLPQLQSLFCASHLLRSG